MLKQTIHFTDYNDQERDVEEYFHLNEAEIIDLQIRSQVGLEKEMQEAILSNDAGRVLDFIKNLVHLSYGKKSTDGLHFDKSPELLHQFITSAYYADFLYGLLENNGEKGQAFVSGILPAKLVERANAKLNGQNGGPVDRTVYAPNAREQFAADQAAKTAGAQDVNSTYPPNSFGQPAYPQINSQPEPAPIQMQQEQPVQQSIPTAVETASPEELARFRAWQASQQQGTPSTQATSAPASPDAFRVREEEPTSVLPRPPHEQTGPAQP